jgi:hypothetical protein
MMVLDLTCGNNHFFEGWFRNMEDFNRQKEAGDIRCPVCEDNRIRQALSAVAIKRSGRGGEENEAPPTPATLLKKFYEYIEKNFEEVGPDFAKEALKMHYGVTEKRNIRGTSTEDEEKLLREEGVEFHKIPYFKIGQE